MNVYVPVAVVGLLFVGLIVRRVVADQRKSRAEKLALDRVGFRPCAEQKSWLEETVALIENTRGYRYEVRDPKRLDGEPAVYHYVKARGRGTDDPPMVEEEILFPLRRPSSAGLVLTVKPSSLPSGLASRIMGAVATGPWDSQPDDLQRLELPSYLKGTNLVGVLGPPGASLHDLVDEGTLSVVKGVGDLGGTVVRFRDTWCSIASVSSQIPFRMEQLIARIRPLL